MAPPGKSATNKRFAKPVPNLPLWRRPPLKEDREPLDGNDFEKEEDQWLEEEGKATEWLGLFYDLVVVAVLSVFSSSHEIHSPAVIPVYLSYFIILTWIWTSQVHYDARYEAEDVYHRLAKLFQIGLLVFIGAASGGWSPGNLLSVRTLLEEAPHAWVPIYEGISHAKAEESFLVIAIAFAASRFVLAVQYALVIVVGRRRGRSILGPVFYVSALLITCGLSGAAAGITPSTRSNVAAKIGLLYAGIAIEILSNAIQNRINFHPAVELGERYGALSLIIIGEGFINLCGALSKGITKLRVTDNTVYIQAFLIIVVMYNIWSFLFAHFRKSDTVGPFKSALWEAVHFPLHFGILLVLAALINAIIMQNWITAANTSLSSFQTIIAPYLPEFNYTESSQEATLKAQLLLQRLSLSPDILTFEEQLGAATQANATDDPLFLISQYQAVIIQGVAAAAGLEVPEIAEDLFHELAASNTTIIHNEEAKSEALQHMYYLFLEGFADTVKEAFSAILWIYPAAGSVLILCALRSLIRYHFEGMAHYLIHGLWVVAGLALALLGLLDIGTPDVLDTHNIQAAFDGDVEAAHHQRPVNILLGNNWLIAVVMVVYTIVNIATVVIAQLFT